MPLKIGDKAPDFSLPSTSGQIFTLSENQKGRSCILYFYPRDFTPGCTAQACGFRNSFDAFKNLNIDVFGISNDPLATHLEFKQKHDLPFELLSDENSAVIRLYGAKVPLLGFTKRITYLLDEQHKIRDIYANMFNAKEHIKKMLEEVKPVSNF